MKKWRNSEAIKAVGKNLKAIRNAKSITQEELAFDSNIELRQIGRIERGEINTGIDSIFVLAKILNVNPAEFFANIDVSEKNTRTKKIK